MSKLNFEQTSGQKQEAGSTHPFLVFLASAITSMWMLEVIVSRAL